MTKMNISSYNITDVTYHYIGLRVLDGMSANSERAEQIEAIANNILKFVSDRNQRLMVAAPSTTYHVTAEKICTELEHFRFAKSQGKSGGGRYDLTESGQHILDLMKAQKLSNCGASWRVPTCGLTTTSALWCKITSPGDRCGVRSK